MFLLRVACSNGHSWDTDADANNDITHPSEAMTPKCPQCGGMCTGPVDPPDLTFKMHMKKTGQEATNAPVIRIR